MKRLLPTTLALMALPFATALAGTVAGPAMYPPGLWEGRGQAVIRVLNRMDSRSEVLTVDANGQTHYRTLDITIRHCLERPPTVPTDSAVDMTIHDTTPNTPAFDGWMVASIPSLAMLQSPLYEVHVVGCAGDAVAPQLPPLAILAPHAQPPAEASSGASPDAPTPLTPENTAPTPLVPPDPQGPPATKPPATNAPTQLVPPDPTPPPAQVPQDDAPLPPPTPLVPDGN